MGGACVRVYKQVGNLLGLIQQVSHVMGLYNRWDGLC